MSVVVVKLAAGNTASVLYALERLGVCARLSDDAAEIGEAERLVLPGVGAAKAAADVIERLGLQSVLRNFPRPLLGICLGMQLLYEESEEGDAAGLALLPGRVRRLPATPLAPSPHMGWSRLWRTRDHALLDGVEEGAYAYFVHSYVCPSGAATIADARLDGPFTAVAARDNVMGCQFHPERSGPVGARILRNFLSLPC